MLAGLTAAKNKILALRWPRRSRFPQSIVGLQQLTEKPAPAELFVFASPADDDKPPVISGADIHLSSQFICVFPPSAHRLCGPGMRHLSPSNNGDMEQQPPHAAVSQRGVVQLRAVPTGAQTGEANVQATAG